MPRGDNDGTIKKVRDGYFVVKKRYTDRHNRPREKKRIVYSATDALRAKRAILKEIDDELAGVEAPTKDRTFAHLVTYYKNGELKPAEYVGDTKIAGLRSFAKFESRLKPLEEFFGAMALISINYQDCLDYKRARLKAATVHGKQRSIASVNRELSLLRHLLFLALRERWIAEHPFHRGKPLIQIADEVSRMRILSWAEEEKILSFCVGRRRHLRLEIITAVETALRQGEQFTLQLDDVDLDDRVINLRAFNSKSAQSRVVPIFKRLLEELAPLMRTRAALQTRTLPVFPFRDPKRAFATVCKLAGIEGLRWHDLRHTAITRMLHFYKIPEAQVMKISGHTNYKTFLRYVNIDREIAKSIAAQVDAARAALVPITSDDLPTFITTDAIN